MSLFKKKEKSTPIEEIKKYCSKPVSCAVERINGEEVNLGKKGGISIAGEDITVLCDGHEVFRCKLKGAVVCGLMSGNGCDIKGSDSVTGKLRHVVCYYAKSPN